MSRTAYQGKTCSHSWLANLVNYSLFAVPASLALFGMTLLAVRQIQRHAIASWRWRTTARRLRREMNRRALAEAELRQAQKMEALGQLTGGVAHDFNNLLTVLQGSLEMLSGRQQSDQLQARVDTALRTVERGERLTEQLLAFARRQPLAKATIDLNAQLRRMTELLVRTVGSGIAISTDLAPDLWPVDADATQLELAVINLAINARDAMPTGGKLGIRTFNLAIPREAVQEQPTVGDFVGLEISDTGQGMPPEVAARAFEPFFTTKEAGKGTGLGLSMVYGFARQSGGSASIRSEVGRGTAVTLLLPRSLRGARTRRSRRDGLAPRRCRHETVPAWGRCRRSRTAQHYSRDIVGGQEMRIVIVGQQAFGKAVLDAFIARGDEVAGVFAAPGAAGGQTRPARRGGAGTQPDRSTASPNIRATRPSGALADLNADLGVMAYVLLFAPPEFCAIPKHGMIQFHPSLLPLHRGASSIPWAIIRGRTETGLSIFRPTPGLDEGPGDPAKARGDRSRRHRRIALFRQDLPARGRGAGRRPPIWSSPAARPKARRTKAGRPMRAGCARPSRASIGPTMSISSTT